MARFRNKQTVMIEIGVSGGGSLAMWKDYLGEGSRVVGIDVNPTCKQHEAEGIELYIGSQEDPALIEEIFQKYPTVDIVLDDGSHVMSHMNASFNLMYERVSPTGLYMVEDTHTCYWPTHGGGLKADGSFMEFVKDKLDEINAVHTKGALPLTSFTRSTACIACYDSVVVFERHPQGNRQAPITDRMK